jgi:hypothetical protein
MRKRPPADVLAVAVRPVEVFGMANREKRNRDQGQQHDRDRDVSRGSDRGRKSDIERGSGGERMRNRSDESDRSSNDRLKDSSRLPE